MHLITNTWLIVIFTQCIVCSSVTKEHRKLFEVTKNENKDQRIFTFTKHNHTLKTQSSPDLEPIIFPHNSYNSPHATSSPLLSFLSNKNTNTRRNIKHASTDYLLKTSVFHNQVELDVQYISISVEYMEAYKSIVTEKDKHMSENPEISAEKFSNNKSICAKENLQYSVLSSMASFISKNAPLHSNMKDFIVHYVDSTYSYKAYKVLEFLKENIDSFEISLERIRRLSTIYELKKQQLKIGNESVLEKDQLHEYKDTINELSINLSHVRKVLNGIAYAGLLRNIFNISKAFKKLTLDGVIKEKDTTNTTDKSFIDNLVYKSFLEGIGNITTGSKEMAIKIHLDGCLEEEYWNYFYIHNTQQNNIKSETLLYIGETAGDFVDNYNEYLALYKIYKTISDAMVYQIN